MVLKILGWVLLGLITLVLLLLFLPVIIRVKISQGVLRVTIQVLGIPIKLLPMEEKKAKLEKSKRKNEKSKKPKKSKKMRKRTMEQWIRLGKRLHAAASDTVKDLLGKIRIRKVKFFMPVKGRDAAQTSLNFGKAQGLVGVVHAWLEMIFNIKFKKLYLVPDFTGESTFKDIYFSCNIIASPAIIIAALFLGVRSFFKYNKRWGQKAVPRVVQQNQQTGPAGNPPTHHENKEQIRSNINGKQ